MTIPEARPTRATIGLLVYAVLFALSRLLVWRFRIKPDPDFVVNHWQNADLVWLDDHLFSTLWNWHAQPPLWNLILGIAVKLAGPNAHAVTALIHWFYVALSFGIGLMLWQIFRRLGAGRLALPLALIILISPSVIYYENYAFYPHFVLFLIVTFVFALVTSRRALALAALVLASWTVALIHPLVVLLVAAPVMMGRGRTALFGLVLAVALACLPSVKNQIAFGVPTPSSWLGLNMAQTVKAFNPRAYRECDFLLVQKQLTAQAPKDAQPPELWQGIKSSGFENMNLVEGISRSRACQALSVQAIIDHPGLWLAGRWHQFVTSTGLRPFQYFFDPKGWRKLQVYEARLENHPMIVAVLSWAFLLLGFIGLIRWAALQPEGKSALLLVVLFLLVAHLFNGEEQQRMRYSIEPLFWIGLVVLARPKRWASDG